MRNVGRRVPQAVGSTAGQPQWVGDVTYQTTPTGQVLRAAKGGTPQYMPVSAQEQPANPAAIPGRTGAKK